ncbi:hypothetical protein P3S68_020434 [Capsicum galapagoense]
MDEQLVGSWNEGFCGYTNAVSQPPLNSYVSAGNGPLFRSLLPGTSMGAMGAMSIQEHENRVQGGPGFKPQLLIGKCAVSKWRWRSEFSGFSSIKIYEVDNCKSCIWCNIE